MFEIYKLTSPSGKCYIGITSKGFTHRLSQHISHWKRGRITCKKLYIAFNKYPPDQWVKEVVYTTSDKKEAIQKEIELIKLFDCVEHGYNISHGGELIMLGLKLTDETKIKISLSQKGIPKPHRTKEHSRRIGEANKGSIPWNKGLKATETARKNQSLSHIGYKHSIESKLKISKNHRRCQTEETRAKLRIIKTGTNHSIESRLKMSKSRIGLKRTLETKQKISNSMTKLRLAQRLAKSSIVA